MQALRSAFNKGRGQSLDENAEGNGSGAASMPRTKLACSRCDDFELSCTLGTGTFGRVRLVKLKNDQRGNSLGTKYFAMKILKKSEIIRLRQVAHIQNEVSLLAELDHPFIVNMVAHFQDPKRIYLVLEYVQGGELFSYLRSKGRIGNESARFYSAQIVLAFGYLHSNMIAYRDLKPENLLITAKGYLKVTDFGFAKKIDHRTFTLCGTPEYLAPEIIQSKGHGRPVDWWALGILCYEMLAGFPPFFDDNAFGIYQRILAGVVEYPRHFDPRAVALIKKCLTADLTKRIGCLKGGVNDVMKAKWYTKTNWKAILEQSVADVPYIPTIAHEADASNFDDYPESPPGSCQPISEADQQQFAAFDVLGFNATTPASVKTAGNPHDE